MYCASLIFAFMPLKHHTLRDLDKEVLNAIFKVCYYIYFLWGDGVGNFLGALHRLPWSVMPFLISFVFKIFIEMFLLKEAKKSAFPR